MKAAIKRYFAKYVFSIFDNVVLATFFKSIYEKVHS